MMHFDANVPSDSPYATCIVSPATAVLVLERLGRVRIHTDARDYGICSEGSENCEICAEIGLSLAQNPTAEAQTPASALQG